MILERSLQMRNADYSKSSLETVKWAYRQKPLPDKTIKALKLLMVEWFSGLCDHYRIVPTSGDMFSLVDRKSRVTMMTYSEIEVLIAKADRLHRHKMQRLLDETRKD